MADNKNKKERKRERERERESFLLFVFFLNSVRTNTWINNARSK
jgi:hypothetical protein